MKTTRLLPLLACICSAPVLAAQDAHVHGEAEMNVALEGQDLIIELASPLANLVGFEHAPENAEQKALLAKAKALLENHESVFGLSGRKCSLESSSVTLPFADDDGEGHHHEEDGHHHEEDGHHHEEDGHHHEEEGHHHEDDEHHHEEEGHHHEEDEHHHDDEHHQEHADAELSYQYHCESSGQALTVDVLLFGAFSKMESIDVNWISDSGQGAKELSAANRTVSIK